MPSATTSEIISTESTAQTEKVFWLKELSSPTVLLDQNFKIVDASDVWQRTFFVDDRKISGKSIFDIFPSFTQAIEGKLDFALEGLKGVQMRDEVYLNDGSTKKIIWHFSAWKNMSGKTIGVMLTAEDITKVKELEYKLLKAKNPPCRKGENR